MENKLKTIIATGVIAVVVGIGALVFTDYEVFVLKRGPDLGLAPVFVEGYCVGGEQILFNTTPESVDEMHCFTELGYKRLQREVLERHRNDDHSNDGLLFAMMRKELSDHKDNLNQSILLSGLIKDGSFDSLIEAYTTTEISF